MAIPLASSWTTSYPSSKYRHTRTCKPNTSTHSLRVVSIILPSHELYKEACKKFDVDTELRARPSDSEVPEWPSGFYNGGQLLRCAPTRRHRVSAHRPMDRSDRQRGRRVRETRRHPCPTPGRAWKVDRTRDRVGSSQQRWIADVPSTRGVRLSPLGDRKARGALRRLILDSESDIGLKTVVRYSRPGWHGDTFVLPTGVTVASGGSRATRLSLPAASGGSRRHLRAVVRARSR